MLSPEWRCSWSSTDRCFSKCIWLMNMFIAYQCAPYIRGMMVVLSCFLTAYSLQQIPDHGGLIQPGISPFQPFLGLLFRCPIFELSQGHSFKDWACIDDITCKWNLQVPNLQMSFWDLTASHTTRIVAPAMTVVWYAHHNHIIKFYCSTGIGLMLEVWVLMFSFIYMQGMFTEVTAT